MTEITIQQAAAFFAAFAIIAVAFAVGEIVRKLAAKLQGGADVEN